MKRNRSLKYILFSCLVFILILISIFSLGFGLLSFKNSKSSSDVELKYTEVNTKIKDGIYITDVSEVVDNVMPSIVSITSKTLITNGRYGPFYRNNNNYSEGAGSGFIVAKDADYLYVVTNNHVVENTTTLSLTFINDKTVDCSIKGYDENKDIAVVSVKLSDLDKDTLNSISIATLGNSNDLKVGNGIIAIGNALGYGQSVTTGVVSALNREVQTDNYTNKMIQIDAAINGGNSGGALLNSKGEVVGINSAKYSSSGTSSSASIEGMGFAIPISDVNNLITDLINGKTNNKITLGIEGYIINTSNIPKGFYVSNVVSNSYASKNGIESGYIITEIDGTNVKDVSDISNSLSNKKIGDSMNIKVYYLVNNNYTYKNIKIIF